MRILGSSHTGFQVADLERSLDFYCGLLEFEVIWRRTVAAPYIGKLVGYPGLELRQALLSIPGSDHCLELLDYRNVDRTAVDTRTANPGTAHICLLVDDLAGIHRRLVEADVQFVSAPLTPTEGPNTGKLVAYLADPDGIRIEMIEEQTAGVPSLDGADAATVPSADGERAAAMSSAEGADAAGERLSRPL